jgi:RimJ/RimL family protein N-acetyltransferase
MDEIITRKALINDLAVLLEFERGIIGTERPFDPTLKDGEIHYYDIAYMITSPVTEVIVAEYNNEVIGSGYARLEDSKVFLKHPKHAFLGFMYVKPEHRGKGVNNKIMEALRKWALSHGVTEFRLEVYHDNLPAIRAYEKVGFSKLLIYMRMGIQETDNTET